MDHGAIGLIVYGLLWGAIWGACCTVIRLHRKNFLQGWHPPIWILRNAISSLVGCAVTSVFLEYVFGYSPTGLTFSKILFCLWVAVNACILVEVPIVWYFRRSYWA